VFNLKKRYFAIPIGALLIKIIWDKKPKATKNAYSHIDPDMLRCLGKKEHEKIKRRKKYAS
jgi:hypothetical protein